MRRMITIKFSLVKYDTVYKGSTFVTVMNSVLINLLDLVEDFAHGGFVFHLLAFFFAQ